MNEKRNGKSKKPISEKTAENGIKFEKTHEQFLTKLKQMPLRTKEEKDERWEFFRAYPLHDEFIMDSIYAYWPEAYKRLYSSLNSIERNRKDAWMATHTNKGEELDTTAFMEALKMVIYNFTGVSQKGIKVGFMACVGRIYEQEAGKAAAIERLGEIGASDSGIPKRNIPRLMGLIYSAKKLYGRNPDMDSPQSALKEILKDCKYHYTKKEMELINGLISWDSITVSLNEVVGTDEKTAFIDNLEDPKDYYEDVMSQEEGSECIRVICQYMEENWKNVMSAKGLRDRENIKMFFTRDILKELKLDRHGKPYLEEPAGDEEIYFSLKAHGTILYREMLYKQYLLAIFIEEPEDFYEVYSKLLRKGVDFSDKFLGTVVKKDKFAISKRKKEYMKTLKACYTYYMDNL